jgi:hypothetical protein
MKSGAPPIVWEVVGAKVFRAHAVGAYFSVENSRKFGAALAIRSIFHADATCAWQRATGLEAENTSLDQQAKSVMTRAQLRTGLAGWFKAGTVPSGVVRVRTH